VVEAAAVAAIGGEVGIRVWRWWWIWGEGGRERDRGRADRVVDSWCGFLACEDEERGGTDVEIESVDVHEERGPAQKQCGLILTQIHEKINVRFGGSDLLIRIFIFYNLFVFFGKIYFKFKQN
jgi:hypothetical protein